MNEEMHHPSCPRMGTTYIAKGRDACICVGKYMEGRVSHYEARNYFCNPNCNRFAPGNTYKDCDCVGSYISCVETDEDWDDEEDDYDADEDWDDIMRDVYQSAMWRQ